MTRGGSQATTPNDEPRAGRFGGRAGLVLMIAVGVALSAGAFLLAREQATTPPGLLEVGDRAPAFTLPAEGGQTVALPAEPGQPTLVAFLETGCSSCREEAPVLAELARGGARVLAVDVSDATAAERAVFARDDLEGAVPIAADPDAEVGPSYRVRVVPTVYAVRADGTIADAWAGRVEPERFSRALAAAGD